MVLMLMCTHIFVLKYAQTGNDIDLQCFYLDVEYFDKSKRFTKNLLVTKM